MKNIFFLGVLLLGIGANAQQQIHPCAEGKIHGYEALLHGGPESNPALADYDVKYVKLDVKLERTGNAIEGIATTKAEVVNGPLGIYVFELITAINISSITINGAPATFTRNGDEVSVTCPSPISQGNTFTAVVSYAGTPPNGGFFNGLSNDVSPSWGNSVTWSLSQPYSAKQWWPCKQALTDKIDSLDVWITTSSSNKAGSNGVLMNITDMGGGKSRYEWKSRHPIDYYLVSVAVAKYVEYSFYANPVGYPPVLIQNYIYDNPSTLIFFQQDIDETADMLEFFSTIFGQYPFSDEKYGHCMAPFSGGMEHQTMTTQGNFNQDLTAHELGHQWFGDNVTCKSWKDLYVSEGFASYSEYLYREFKSSVSARNWIDDVHNNVLSQVGGSVYVPDTADLGRLFSGRLTYNKAAAINHTLRFVVNNDSLFFAGLKNYQAAFANSTATGDDFKVSMETTTGLDLDTFFLQWYYGEGYPVFDIQYYHDINSGNFFLRVLQTASFPSVTPVFVTPLELRLTGTGVDTTVRVDLHQSSEDFLLQVGGVVNQINVDPNQWVLNMVGTISQNQMLAVPQEKEMAWKVFPNPAYDQLTIQASQALGNIEIHDASGKLVAVHAAGLQQQIIIPVAKLVPGTYFIHSEGKPAAAFIKQ